VKNPRPLQELKDNVGIGIAGFQSTDRKCVNKYFHNVPFLLMYMNLALEDCSMKTRKMN
jgi:hypothetical protein